MQLYLRQYWRRTSRLRSVFECETKVRDALQRSLDKDGRNLLLGSACNDFQYFISSLLRDVVTHHNSVTLLPMSVLLRAEQG
jgi:hypothetical protein